MLHHVRLGEGPPLVLVPGTASTWFTWHPVLDRLARAGRDVIAVDLPGFGDTPALPDGDTPTPPRLARALADGLDELGLHEPVAVAGTSLGGAVAIELARLGRAASVCALAPAGLWNDAEAAYCCASMLATARAKATPAGVLRAGMAVAPVRAVAMAQVFGRGAWAMSGEDATALATMPAPDTVRIVDAYRDYRIAAGALAVALTVAWGGADLLLPPWQLRRAGRAFPGARIVRLRGLSHQPQWEDPALVAQTILDATA